jgi:hypothetical protein
MFVAMQSSGSGSNSKARSGSQRIDERLPAASVQEDGREAAWVEWNDMVCA